MKHQKYIVENNEGKVVKSFKKLTEAENFSYNKGYIVVLNTNTQDDRKIARELKRFGGF